MISRGAGGAWALSAQWAVGGARGVSVVACSATRAVAAAGPRLYLLAVGDRELTLIKYVASN